MSRLVVLRIAFWAAALLSLTMASLPQPPQLPGAAADKVQHILAFAVLAMLGSLAYPRVKLVVIALALSAFGAGIELIQTIPAISRDGSAADWLADTLAAGVVLLLVHRTRSRNARNVGQNG